MGKICASFVYTAWVLVRYSMICITTLICSVLGEEKMTDDCTEICKHPEFLHLGRGLRKSQLLGYLSWEQVCVL